MLTPDAPEEIYERRTISISPKLHSLLQDFRGRLIQDLNDVDYTTLVNYVLAYGLVFIDRHPEVRTAEDDATVSNLVGDRFRLTELSLGDEYENLYRRRQETGALGSEEISSAKRKKNEDVH